MKNIKTKLIVASTLVLALLVGGIYTHIIPVRITYSEGERSGVVNKLSSKGWICKTWEGQLNLGGMASDGNGIATVNTWEYSVSDPAVVKKLEDAASTGRRATLVYKQYVINGRCNGSTAYDIVDVK